MSTDRELLEAAARACGIEVAHIDDLGVVPANTREDGPNQGTWNPLTDDGDALRLAVKLRFAIKDFAPFDSPELVQAPPDAVQWGMVEIWRQDDNDPLHVEWYKAGADRYAATRLAIVRAAASIGAAMKGTP